MNSVWILRRLISGMILGAWAEKEAAVGAALTLPGAEGVFEHCEDALSVCDENDEALYSLDRLPVN